MVKKLLLVALLGAVAVVGLQANALALVTIVADQAAAQAAGQDGVGDFTATLSWDSMLSKLTMTLDNTTDELYGGVIVRADFNNPEVDNEEIINTLILSSTSMGFAELNYDVNDSPFGEFDYSINLRDTPEYPGLGINDPIATFVFDVTLNPGKTLTELDFANAFSTGGNYSAFYFARFQEMSEDGDLSGSDKVPGTTDDSGDPVPEPATLLLLGPALLGLLSRKKK